MFAEPSIDSASDALVRRPSARSLVWLVPFLGVLQLFWQVSLFYGLLLGSSAAVYALYVRRKEHRAVFELRGGRIGFRDAALGVVAGLAVAVFAVPMSLLTGVAAMVGATDSQAAFSISLGATVFTVGAAVFEEVVYRGVVLRYVELWLGSWMALALSSLLFAAAHFLGAPQTPVTLVEHAAGGLLFGAGYLLTRRLWAAIGLHLGVNLGSTFFYGWIDTTPIIALAVRGNGGDFWWAVAKILLAAILLGIAHRRGRLVSAQEAWPAQCGSGERILTSVPCR